MTVLVRLGQLRCLNQVIRAIALLPLCGVCFAQPYSVCRSPLKGASRLQAICEAYQLPIQSLISRLTGMPITVGGHSLPKNKISKRIVSLIRENYQVILPVGRERCEKQRMNQIPYGIINFFIV